MLAEPDAEPLISAGPPGHLVEKMPHLSSAAKLPAVQADQAGNIVSAAAHPVGPQVVVPILMYHYLGDLPPNPDAIRRDLTVSPVRFEAQLASLRNQGYHTLSLRQLYDHLTTGSPLPPKPIILTFDDGYLDNYENAYPLLLRYGFTATFFIISDFADASQPGYMTWDQLREMHARGMEIEAHSRSHPDLRNRKLAFLKAQIGGSRDAIESQIGTRPRFLAYPAGKYDQAVIDTLRAEGFSGAVTTRQGIRHSAEHLFELMRIRVRGTYNEVDLKRVLAQ
ncbi:MAG: hypothetical protein A2Z04_08090 [Chloroflexi bacterium RBG_16_57_9]|nr:MAG: hypothetical protein A2Z04_08090 [Chloroflexi bacterium RBG_16_57_9]